MSRFNLSEISQDAHIHFIGIGGISMSGLALICLDKGYSVSGSDRNRTEIIKKLERLGARVFEGHSAENVSGADLVVHTAAVKNDNPEMKMASELGIRTIDRAEFLGAVMKNYKRAVGVSGTHGKTTTTSMIAHALIYADTDPTISVGGELDLIGGNIRVGNSDIFVTEACEYTNSFLKFYPTIALITNIEEDHLDFFEGLDDIMKSFRAFAELTRGCGVVIACTDDKNVRDALDGSELEIIRYGLLECDGYHTKNIVYRAGFPEFDVYFKESFCAHVDMKVPGEHNIQNALAAIAVLKELGIGYETAAKGIETYTGVHRRFEKKGEVNGALIIDDYSHHPTEIKAALSAARKFSPDRIVCIFQPHTYSRTKALWNEFLEAFGDADEVIVLDIFAAREVYDGQTSSEDLASALLKNGACAKYIDSFKECAEYIKNRAKKGDIVFTMGAGDVYKIGDMLTNKE